MTHSRQSSQTHIVNKPHFGPTARLMDVHAVSSILQCSVRHVNRLVARGEFPKPIRLGSLVRWPEEVINEWIASANCRASTAERRGRGGAA